MKYENEIRQLLINNTIRLVAEGGFERATTRGMTFCDGLCHDFKMNEVYIYRLFGSKENLYEQTFLYLDKELFAAFRSGAKLADDLETDTQSKLYRVFLSAWQYVIHHEERCRYCVCYYYSAYFKGKSKQEHRKLVGEMVKRLSPIFKDSADTGAILHIMFTVAFSFAVCVHNGELENSEENRDRIFNMLYCMMVVYLKNQPIHPQLQPCDRAAGRSPSSANMDIS